MEIIVGKTAGFCYGVKRAVDGSLNQIKENNNKIYCLGELVHNKQVVTELEDKGIKVIEKISDAPKKSTVIIRAHGVEKKIYNIAKENELEIIDYTCPNVLKIHDLAKEYEQNGFYIFLTGSENHPEIIGTKSYCGKNSIVISDENDVKNAMSKFEKSGTKKLLLISQTTYSLDKFEKIKKMVEQDIENNVEVVIKNTICLATEQRQKETQKLSQEVDCMIIIGGKNSSNTKKLYDIAKENCTNTILIETKDEINKENIKDFESVGIMAGASTPQKSIDDVIGILK